MRINSPVVLVGLPRSGSTLLTRVINESPDHYVLNDLYYLQLIDRHNGWSGFKSAAEASEAKALVQHMICHRSAVHSSKGIANSAEMTSAQLGETLARLRTVWPRKNELKVSGDWADVLENVIATAADVLGKHGWGWNTPQDYHHLDRIIDRWPHARIIFMMRDPGATLRSYKFYPKRPAADRYHPIAQSMAWRNAARAWKKYSAKYPNNLLLIRYNDIVTGTPEQIRRINAFLPAKIDENLELAKFGDNSSHARSGGGEKPGALDPVERWLSDSTLYSQRVLLGFDSPRCKLSLQGILPLMRTTFRFLAYYGREALSNPNTRRRIKRLLLP